VVEALRLAKQMPKDKILVICFSGRGDKDCYEVARLLGLDLEGDSTHS
jgi:tryptophan synthase beta chain